MSTKVNSATSSLINEQNICGYFDHQAGSYVSVFVENNTNKPLVILEQSSFSGLMIGR